MKGFVILMIVLAFFAGQMRAFSVETDRKNCNYDKGGFYYYFDYMTRKCHKKPSYSGGPVWVRPD